MYINSILFQSVVDSLDYALAGAALGDVLVFHLVLVTVFINCVICQVSELCLVQVSLLFAFLRGVSLETILLSSETGKSLIVPEDRQGVT